MCLMEQQNTRVAKKCCERDFFFFYEIAYFFYCVFLIYFNLTI